MEADQLRSGTMAPRDECLTGVHLYIEDACHEEPQLYVIKTVGFMPELLD